MDSQEIPFENWSEELFIPGKGKPRLSRCQKRVERLKYTYQADPHPLDMPASELQSLQETDQSLENVRQMADKESTLLGSQLYRQNGLMYRRYIPPNYVDNPTMVEQLVVPLPMGEPFQRIAVGPLPRSRSRKKYILVICDSATRYPEAIPLRSIKTEIIAEELLKFVSRVGIQKEILTDQGSNFISKLLAEVYNLLCIEPIQTDHRSLEWLNRLKDTNARLTGWSLELQSYTFVVRHRAGKANANADGLSRSYNPDKTTLLQEKEDGV